MMKRQQISDTPKKLTRAEKSELIRRKLLDAAATVVGEVGYRDASITLIAQRAGVANGTFYNYFETRQDLFDILLPIVGKNLLAHIRRNMDLDLTGINRERARYRAYIDYCKKNPGFGRILDEAAVYAPKAFITHMQTFASGYERSLRRSQEKGEITEFSDRELPVVAFMLMGARSYFNILNDADEFAEIRPSPEELEDTYIKILEGGLFR